MPEAQPMPQVTIPPVRKPHGILGLGCWAFAGAAWGGQDDDASRAAMQTAFAAGMNHFDTARAYGGGKSERVLAPFIAKHRDAIFLATKGNTDKTAQPAEIRKQLQASLTDLGVDHVDLYYMHWPRSGKDMKPVFEELEKARGKGLIGALGLSNFSVEQMQDVSQVARIDTHQLCYNLLWRPLEDEVIPYCREHDIAVVTYSSIAQGILTGKFGKELPQFPEGDQRNKVTLFDPGAWPHVAEGVQQMQAVAQREGQPLVNLAIQWVARQPGVTSVLLGARNAEQAQQNGSAYDQPVSDQALEELTAISDQIIPHIPATGNIFKHYP